MTTGDKHSARAYARAFAEWLSFNLEEQRADLDLYVFTVAADKPSIPENWLSVVAHKTFSPNSAKTVEKRLYAADMEALMSLLKNEHGAAAPDRGA